MALREILYRVRLKNNSRPPALPFALLPGAQLQVETLSTNLDAAGHVWRLVQVHGGAKDLEVLARRFRTERSLHLVERRVVGRGGNVLLLWYKYGATHEHGLSLTRLALDVLGPETIVTDRTTAEGLDVRILTPGGRHLGPFLRRLQAEAEQHHKFRLLYVGPPRVVPPSALTAVEEQALAAARDAGFFAVPRRGSMRSLARDLGCSPSAASARLRRGVAKLVDFHVSR